MIRLSIDDCRLSIEEQRAAITHQSRVLLAVVLSVGFMLVGCNRQPYVTPERLDRGLVIVLPGIEGRSPWNEAICRGLDEGGVDCAIELRDWTSLWGPLFNLRAEVRNRRQARRIAQRITLYQWEHPDRPVVLVGQSGGGAMAAWIAEALGEDGAVDGIVMLAPALSPEYMLDLALAGSRRGIINFHSSQDWFLGVGTTVSGTMDGYHTSSAGRVGFDVPPPGPGRTDGDGRTELHRKLFQIPWTREMSVSGHTGGHLTSSSVRYVARYVAPFVRAEDWNAQLVARVTRGGE